MSLVLAVCSVGTQGATPPGTSIVNTATASFSVSGVPVSVAGAATIVMDASTPAAIRLLSSADGVAGLAQVASSIGVAPTQCNGSGGWTTLAAPVAPGQGTLQVPGDHLLVPATTYAKGDVVLVQVTDFDQNRDPAVRETVTVLLQTASGDREQLRLAETGATTGVFVGYIQSVSGAAQPGNCVLEAGGNERLTASYVDASESGVAITAGALIDPFGIVFDSSSGEPVSGARVTIVHTATGQPAQVFGNDGVSTFPSTVVTGSTVTDSGGASYSFAPGRYQFPRLAPGSYRFQVQTPPGYRFPSQAGDAAVQALPNGPFVIAPGSRGEVFTLVPGPALEIDLPVDPAPLGDLSITKSAGKAAAAIGDFVPYTLAITSRSGHDIGDVRIADLLPVGFRYQGGSARIGKQPLADPQIGPDGRSLQFALGTVAANASVTVQYVAAIGPGARLGPAENSAQAVGRVTSNVARATILVKDDLNRTRAILMGRVTLAQSCAQDEREPGAVKGLAGVRVLLQDGTAITTDAQGEWHAENLRPGTHVVQVDTTTLPPGMELRSCDASSRTGGRDFSQLVNVRGGTLWRADFRLVRSTSCVDQRLQREGSRVQLRMGSRLAQQAVTATVILPPGSTVVPGSVTLDGQPHPQAQVDDEFVVVRLGAQPARWERSIVLQLKDAAAGDVKALLRVQAAGQAMAGLQPLVLKPDDAQAAQCAPVPAIAAAAGPAAQDTSKPARDAAPLQLVEQLPYDDKWLAAAPAGNEWLHPQTGFTPALPAVKVAVKHARGSLAVLRVNGNPVDPLRFDGSQASPNGELLLSNWRAVDLREGANLLEVTVRDAAGQVLLQESRTLHYAVGPSSVSFDASRSQLVADGRTSPLVAVRLLDRNGKPVRRGVAGEVNVAPPYFPQQLADALQQDPLGGAVGGRARFQVGDDGVALVALAPTLQAGEAVLRFDFGDSRQHEVRAWLQADLREWVLVGFAEGTLGHRRLAGNLQALADSEAGEQLFDRDRVAFYAKGRVRGDFLLTVAYDSAKEKATGHQRVLKQAIDPNQYYTLYGDAATPQYDAASTSKLYLRIEKKQFYALFGDHDTGLTVTELGRYSRTLTGLKSGYKGETFSYTAFAARTRQGFMRDELQGDGTSGLYRLRARGLLAGSEKVRIETRDRYQPDRVLKVRALTPFIDYQVDRELGTLFFREPVPSRDEDFNLLFIVVEYETDEDGSEAGWTFGGRAAARIGERAEVGLTHLREGNPGREGRLTAADATLRLGEGTRLRAEVATSRSNTAAGPQGGHAYLLEATHDDGRTAARAYAGEQQPGFGLGQQAAAGAGQRKIGADARHRISDTLQVHGEAYRQENLSTGGERKVAEAGVQWSNKEAGLTVAAGARIANETDSAGKDSEARQVTGGVGYEMMEGKLVLRGSADLDVGSPGTVNFPNRLLLGADYRLTPGTTLTAQHEIARGDELRANTTRIGLRTELWSGAEAVLGGGSQQALDAGRLFANLGLVQKIRISEHWSADAAIERVHTLRSSTNPLGPAQPPASGTPPAAGYGILTGDHTAVSLGLAYHDAQWSGNARAEWRESSTETKVNLLAGAQRKLGDGRIVAAGLSVLDSEGPDADLRKVTLRASHASRPADSRWAYLQRLEYVEDANRSLAGRLLTRKLIANFNANFKASPRTQVALQYSGKYVREMLGDTAYSGYTDLWGAEARHDLNDRWDVGVHAGVLNSWRTGTRSWQLGLSVGYRLADNTWVSVGYNHLGFSDGDFAGAQYRAQGLYVNVRVKFDQDTFDLNDRASTLPVKP